MIHILRELRLSFFIVFFDEIHIKYESKYTEERRRSKYGLDSRKYITVGGTYYVTENDLQIRKRTDCL